MMRVAGALATIAMLASCVAAPPRPVQPPERGFVTPGLPAPPPALGAMRWSGSAMQGGLIHGTAPAGATRATIDGRPLPLAPDGQFIAAFDRDAGPSVRFVFAADTPAIPPEDETLTIAPRAWNISRLDGLPKYPVPAPAFAALRPAELAQIAAARRTATDAAGWRQRFTWPATGRISTLFGSQRTYANGEAGDYHSGIDIALPTGTPVRAPADGVVILAADHPFTLEGNLLMLDHGMGLSSAFLHLSRIDVRAGDHVRQGQVIGAVGMTGRATGPHLHWGLKWQAARIDPLLVAGPMPGG